MATYSTCRTPTCGTTVEGKASVCPNCGGPMRGVGDSKMRGWLLLVLGLFLVLFMGWIAIALLPTLSAPGREIADGSRFTGDAGQARMILLLFAMVIAFGFVSIAYGAYMIATGRQNRLFMIASLGVAAILIGVAWLTTQSLKHDAPPVADKPPFSAPG